MKATRLEYRFRFALHALLYVLGFTAPWASRSSLAAKSTWVTIASVFSQHRWLHFLAAIDMLLVLAILFTLLGAFFRVWGSAYVGSSVVASREMHSERMLADGPYRRTRNPLYLGTLLHTVGISLLMPLSGAVFCIVTIWVLQIRLALAEEPFLAERFGAPYLEYCKRVPRFLPSLTPWYPLQDSGQHGCNRCWASSTSLQSPSCWPSGDGSSARAHYSAD